MQETHIPEGESRSQNVTHSLFTGIIWRLRRPIRMKTRATAFFEREALLSALVSRHCSLISVGTFCRVTRVEVMTWFGAYQQWNSRPTMRGLGDRSPHLICGVTRGPSPQGTCLLYVSVTKYIGYDDSPCKLFVAKVCKKH